MFDGLFSTKTKQIIKPKSNQLFGDLFSKQEKTSVITKTESVKPVVRTLPSGGQFLEMPDKSLTTTPRGYGDFKIKPGQERDHIIPVSLGGTSDNPNIQYLKSNKTILEKIFNQPASAKNRQEGKMLVELKAIDEYKAGKISLDQARVKVLNWNNQPESFYKTYAKELIKSPVTAGKMVGDSFNNLFKKTGENIEEGEYWKAAQEAGTAITEGITKPILKFPGRFVKEAVIPGVEFLDNKIRKPIVNSFKEADEFQAQQLLERGDAKTIEEARMISKAINISAGVTEPLKNVGGALKPVAKKLLNKVSQEAKSLIQEAKKYKSAEEFVKAQGETVYRGGVDLSKGKITNSGISVSKGKNVAEDFVKQKGGTVQEHLISLDAKIINYSDVPNVRFKNLNDYSPELDTGNRQIWKDLEVEYQKAVDWAKSNGYDGIKLPLEGETRIINPDVLKTKSQLTDIWSQAQKKDIAPMDYFKARNTRLTKLKEARDGDIGIKVMAKIETNQQKLSTLDNDVVNALKNTPSYKKEGSILDAMGEGVVMRDPATKKTLIATFTKVGDELSEVEKYTQKGYQRVMSIDQLAQEAGFERGYDFLESQLNISKIPRGQNLTREIEKELMKIDSEFKQASEAIQKVSQEKVPKGQYLTQKAKEEVNEMRKTTLRTVRDYFGLSDKDMKTISAKDVRYMSNKEYDSFIQQVETQADILSNKRQKLNEVMEIISRKELQNVDNLQKIQQLPKIENMTTQQLDEFGKLLESYKTGDVFFTPRRAEVIETTDLKGARTWREVKEMMAKELNVPIEELSQIKIKELDRFRGDIALSRKNPLFKWMVDVKNEVLLKNNHEYFTWENTLNTYAKNIKDSNKIANVLVPQQKELRVFLEAPPELKADLAKQLTAEELAIAKHIRQATNMVYDYLLSTKELLGSRFSNDNYIMHSRRPISEMLKDLPETGIKGVLTEVLQKHKLDEAVFTILDTKTGEILAPHKFFANTLFRSGELKPTENIIEATRKYMQQFYTKKALDEIVPKIETYVMALQPHGKTKRGMFLDESLKKFTNEWLNANKGRNIDFVVKQGGVLEAGLRAGKMMMSTLYLGLNLATGAASKVGSQISAFGALGNKKYLVGRYRMNTKQGKAILENYKEFVGKNVWEDLIEPAKNVGDRFQTALFGFFKSANYQAKANYLLGEMTELEFKTGKVDFKRMAEMKLALGRWLDDKTLKSIVGRTEVGKTVTQFKDWAIPILDTLSNDASIISKQLFNKQFKEALTGQEIQEIGRVLETGIAVYLGYEFIKPDKEDKSLIGQLKTKTVRELSTFYQALNPTTYLTNPVLADFIFKFAKNLESLAKLEQYKTGENKGDLKGVEALTKQFTPSVIKQLQSEEENSGLPTLPKLPQLPKLPSLPKL